MGRKNNLNEIAIEAGRKKHPSRKRLYRNSIDFVQEKEGMRHMHRIGGYNKFSQLDNLGPLLKWLRSHVGQPWNKINSLLSKNLGTGLAAQQLSFVIIVLKT